ncbi:MAG: SCP2 sterol-binding domain-containing protein [Proteobacteria bacterium]|nr:SCP2 sterol-binding domain-containing protein [Pseudomonadota bacterium]MBI3499271.1 SCP2 sterol-binding domain-containing protein [Pseudomonadota bacterium]
MSLESATQDLKRRAAVAPSLGYKVKFLLGAEGIILWDGTATPAKIDNADGEADTTIKIALGDFEKLLTGNLDPTLAYATGKIKVEGSVGVALKMAGLLSD